MDEVGSVVALDVGGTLMKGWVCDRDGAALRRAERATPVERGPDAVVAAVREIVRELHAGDASVRAAGVVVPGMVDAKTGIASYAANLGWHDVPLRLMVQDDLGIPVALDHDVRAGGLAEAVLGAAAGVEGSLFVPIGTGIAGAMIIRGEIYAGARGAAGEVGHLIVYPDGELCACGQRGCVETYASASAIARRYYDRTGDRRTAADIAVRLDADDIARAVWADAVDALGLGLAACTMLLDPALIVLGGGLAAAGDALTEPVAAALASRLAWLDAPPIVPAALGSEAGRFGAAILAWRASGEPDPAPAWAAARAGSPS